ncbi:citrate lyase holo-[acyl-carrier protein] synthase [Candidatus Epulonipiscium viviparus]|uniref:citrate lyase holo-[acyl-carrier protein] synthase n=1 Tax=Candidatus Epulonipiscium viviparus TaxID=420336 RepID=UPI0027380778|nr:citrate lyase holo-[acyl-carrier protein] synthase [Candidatus Epulopiscium viviparus]
MIEEFLYAREQRVAHQNELCSQHPQKTLVTLKINYPGLEKSNYINDSIIKALAAEILSYYPEIVYHESYESLEGLIYHFIFDASLTATKEEMVSLEENHQLGRLVDIDVYNLGAAISRKDLGLPVRKCFICSNDAHICSRARTHSIDAIASHFRCAYADYASTTAEITKIAEELAMLATKAIVCEVSTYPSFGLVSPVSNGAHTDMDYYMFLDSAMAIKPFLKKMAIMGYSFHSPLRIFNAIRTVGKAAEAAMFAATGGVNTHKGVIFLMGICISAVAKNKFGETESVSEIIESMTQNILYDFENLQDKAELTHGEQLYVRYGFTGVRGQVKDGLKVIFEYIVPKYKNSELPKRELYCQILIELMALVDDSTVVYRHNFDMLKKVKQDAQTILAAGGISTKEGLTLVEKIGAEYIANRVSSGGCADLLSISIFILAV